MKNKLDPSKVRISTKQISVDSILRKISVKEIDLYVPSKDWAVITNDVRSQFIESLLLGIPVTLYVDAAHNQWAVMNGIHKIKALKAFILDSEFALNQLEYFPELNGKTWGDLPRSYQRKIEETEFIVHIIEPGTPRDVKFDILQRINDLS